MSTFREFFDHEFHQMLADTAIPDMPGASWDRRAAWLLWNALGRATAPTTRYFYHPESECFFTKTSDAPLADGHVVELDEAEWRARQQKVAPSPAAPADDLEDLLG